MFDFTPNNQPKETTVIFFEDSKAETAPNYETRKTRPQLEKELINELALLGAHNIRLTSGKFTIDKRARYGYQVEFIYEGRRGRIQLAALPLRNWTRIKENQVQCQALANLRDMLKVMRIQPLFLPAAGHFLAMHTYLPSGATLAEAAHIFVTNPDTPLALPAPENAPLEGSWEEV